MRTAYDVGWNDTAYGINTYPGGSETEECRAWVGRMYDLALAAQDSPGNAEYARGVQEVCINYLDHDVQLVSYRGGWRPGC